ncbi:MAG: MGH1-like glycoside hydrolase domain-containing protein [Mycobacteriales bacterium]
MTSSGEARAGEAEVARLRAADRDGVAWRLWGPYLAERAWGSVREDYSVDGDAWGYFPFDHARSRAYRWNEDGLGGICDEQQHFAFAFAFWNGADRELKERAFGLTNGEGNHGEDVKDYWWYLDSTPTHSWLRWRYHYPQAAFPYERLRAENAARGREVGEFELIDTGVFDQDRFFVITVEYAKASPTDYCIRLQATNQGDRAAALHVLPTLWFPNRWAWGLPDQAVPELHADHGRLCGHHPAIGRITLCGDGSPQALACDNETNAALLFGVPGRSRYPKDGIGDHVVHGADTVNPAGSGTKGALWYRAELSPGETLTVRLRLSAGSTDQAGPPDLGGSWERVMRARQAEADDFFDALLPANCPNDERLVARQALAGLAWSKQYYHFDVARWLAGDPAGPAPPASRRQGRDASWTHLQASDVIFMPDTWEYPWFAAWDLAFHCVVAARSDPELAKRQLLLLCREWYMSPRGQLPAYEWNFSDVNPPVQAWAALEVFRLDGGRDRDFLERMFHKLLINFTWWVNREDVAGGNVFSGGFLGLDNIGPFDRSALPVAGVLEQSDGTAWMAIFCLDMLEMALELAMADPTYADVATKFFEHFCYISTALTGAGLWDETDGFFYDLLRTPSGALVPLRVRSIVGLVPACAVLGIGEDHLRAVPEFRERLDWFGRNRPELIGSVRTSTGGDGPRYLLSLTSPEQLSRLLSRVFDESEFLSPYGIRAVSAYHRDHPFTANVEGVTATVDYEPAESRSGLFGGNSNWRGPVWFPLNYLLVQALHRHGTYLGSSMALTVAGRQLSLSAAADELAARLISIFTDDASGRRPVFNGTPAFQAQGPWHDLIPFHEYFHGDTGAGLGASHQTGWTALVAALILQRRGSGGAPRAVRRTW